jgi:sugar (pentulose or hexulose) kinase
LNLYNKKYSVEVLDALGVGKYKNVFPEPVESTQIIGRVSKAGCIESGIREGVPVIAGSIDCAAVTLGAGLTDVGDACTIIGTTLASELIHEKQHINFKTGLVVCPISNSNYITIMPTLNGTATIDWVKDLLAPDVSFKELEDGIENIPLGSRGIICHPYIHGERSPFRNPFACGGFYGLTSVHTKLDMLRAAFEGVTYSMYDCYQFLPKIYKQVTVSGGGANSAFLCQMFADCLGTELLRSSIKQQGLYGMYYALKVALGYESDFKNIDAKINERYKPDLDRHYKYLHQFKKYKDIRTSMETFWKERHL